MPWWGWLLSAWTAVAVAAAFWVGAAAAIARRRERAAHRYQYRQVILAELPRQRDAV
jgi:hypothetical protein